MGFVIEVIRGMFSVYWYVLLATAVMGFLPELRQTKVGFILTRLTDPYLHVFRRFIPPLSIGRISLDISWLVGVVVFLVIEGAVTNILFRLLMTAP